MENKIKKILRSINMIIYFLKMIFMIFGKRDKKNLIIRDIYLSYWIAVIQEIG
jgi:hypothetical protein